LRIEGRAGVKKNGIKRDQAGCDQQPGRATVFRAEPIKQENGGYDQEELDEANAGDASSQGPDRDKEEGVSGRSTGCELRAVQGVALAMEHVVAEGEVFPFVFEADSRREINRVDRASNQVENQEKNAGQTEVAGTKFSGCDLDF